MRSIAAARSPSFSMSQFGQSFSLLAHADINWYSSLLIFVLIGLLDQVIHRSDANPVTDRPASGSAPGVSLDRSLSVWRSGIKQKRLLLRGFNPNAGSQLADHLYTLLPAAPQRFNVLLLSLQCYSSNRTCSLPVLLHIFIMCRALLYAVP